MKTKLLTLLLALITSNLFAQFPTNGLVAQYNFNNTTPLQENINGDNFVLTGTNAAVTTDRFGNNSAYNLAGDYLDRPDVATSATDLTLNFWLKTNVSGNQEMVIINDTNTSAPNVFATGTNPSIGYLITMLSNGQLQLKVRSRAGNNFYASSMRHNMDIRDNQWHNITIYMKEEPHSAIPSLFRFILNIDVDGVVLSATSGYNNRGSSLVYQGIHGVGSMTIGNVQSSLGVANRYPGTIDDLLIYDRALTTAEKTAIRNQGNYCFTPQASILTATATGETTAIVDVNGTTGSNYDIAYHKASEPFTNAIIVQNISTGTATATLTGLQPSTPYKIYIRTQCTITTNWSAARDFRTEGRIYINKNATGANDGSSWTDAYNELRDVFPLTTNNQEYWVAAGTYTPSATVNRATSFSIFAVNVKMYGGFFGNETQLNQRIVGSNETTLSGDINGNDSNLIAYANATKQDNAYHVIQVRGNDTELLLDGLVIENGFANGSGGSGFGAAIYQTSGAKKLTLMNCKIQNNISFTTGTVDVRFTSNSNSNTLDVKNCKFSNNLSALGTGMYNVITRNLIIKVSNCLFANNTSTGETGSAMVIRNVASGNTIDLDIYNTTFVDNIDEGQTTGYNNRNRTTLSIEEDLGTVNTDIANCIFWNNKARGGVGAKAISGGLKTLPVNLTVNNSIDEDNFSNISSGKTNTNNTDPLFTDAANGDYTLSTGSPAIDTGNNTKVIGQSDLLGNDRIYTTIVDMGAYEFGAPVATLNNDVAIVKTNTLSIYPNPVYDVLYVSEKVQSITLFNISGQLVAQTTAQQLQVSQLPTGIYFAKVITTNGEIITKKVIKN